MSDLVGPKLLFFSRTGSYVNQKFDHDDLLLTFSMLSNIVKSISFFPIFFRVFLIFEP